MAAARKRGPGRPTKPARERAVTTSLRLRGEDLERLDRLRAALSTDEREAREADVWREGLRALERELIARGELSDGER